jgi:hypothetical protein
MAICMAIGGLALVSFSRSHIYNREQWRSAAKAISSVHDFSTLNARLSMSTDADS